ncbi:SDR family oxidoreductase [Microvirga sp. 2YAF29]|uniref:SDR family oxidoreductase n=1 Tax=Microvirga sp. 2YAF29 TaxID=3233031 RepID=UPI003F98B348
MANSLEGRLAVITGAGGGIGATMIRCFQEAGAKVVACDVSEDALEALDVAHKEFFDLSNAGACRQACERIQSKFGLPDIIISNAGYTRAETLEQVDDQAWNFELDVNLNGARNFTAPFLEPMKARGSGVFVFISSVNALAHFGNPAYAAAKAGLVAYARAIATEYGIHGIRSNAICPGSVRTHAWDHRIEKDPHILKKVSRLYPLGHMVAPVDVANAAVFLASPLSAGITGVTLPVDGGLTAGNLPFIDAIR